jgi:hypothetical protein
MSSLYAPWVEASCAAAAVIPLMQHTGHISEPTFRTAAFYPHSSPCQQLAE